MIDQKILAERERYLVEECLPLVLLPYVKCVLSDPDAERIQAVNNNYGPSRAISELVDFVKKRKEEGFKQLVLALRATGYHHTAMLLDPQMKVSSDGNEFSLSENQHQIVEILGTASDLEVLTRLHDKDNTNGNIDTKEIHDQLLKELRTKNKEHSERLREIRLIIQKHLPEGVAFVGLSEGSLKLIFRISLREGLDKFCDLIEDGTIEEKLEIILEDVRNQEQINLGFRELSIMPEERKRVSDVLQRGVENIENDSWEILKSDPNIKESLIEKLKIPPVYTLDRSASKELIIRDYQIQLAKPAIEGKNLIICSPTGSGKTYMAMHIVKHHIELAKSGAVAGGDNKISDASESGAAGVDTSGSVLSTEEINRSHDPARNPAKSEVASSGAVKKDAKSDVSENVGSCVVDEKVPKVLFIVNRVPLVTQQKERFTSYLPQFVVEESCGGSTNEVPLSGIIKHCDIVVLTAQILVNALIDRDVKLTDFSLLIFDECHHTQKEHPYNKIMSNYISTKLNPSTMPGQLPQIVGLTASVGVGGAKSTSQAVSHIMELSANLDTEVLSYIQDEKDQKTMAEHVAAPVVSVKETKERENDIFLHVFSCIMSQIEGLARQEPKDKALENIPSCKGEQPYENWCVKLEECGSQKANRYLVTFAEQLRVYNNALIINKDCRTVDALKHIGRYFDSLNQSKFMEVDKKLYGLYFKGKETIEKALKEGRLGENPKLTLIMKELQENFRRGNSENENNIKSDGDMERVAKQENEENVKSDPESVDEDTFEDAQEFHLPEAKPQKAKEEDPPKNGPKGILFTRTRDSTEAFVEWIKEHPELTFLRPHVLVGGTSRKNAIAQNQREQRDAIMKFEMGEYNLLVSTTVGEEGLDIPDCNYVIRYNMAGNEISTVQSRGRIRARDQKARFTQVVGTKGRERVKINLIKEILMHDAISVVMKIPADTFKKKIRSSQESSFKTRNYKERLRYKLKQTHKQCENIVFHCKKCNAKAFRSEDVGAHGSSYIVCNTDFYDVVDIKEHPRPQVLPDFDKKGKIYCKECGLDWGIVAKFEGGAVVPVVKVCQFILSFPNGPRRSYKQWGKVPFEVAKVDIFDIDFPDFEIPHTGSNS